MPIAALLGVAVIGLFAMSWLLNRDTLRHAVEAQIRAVTGLDFVVNGAVDVSVFPGSYVSFHDVGLKGGGSIDPALTVDVLTANLRLLPLLLQRFEIADMMMLRPRIRVIREASGESNWTPFIESIARTMRPGAEQPLSFSEIRIQDGVLHYQDPYNTERLGDIDLSLAWPSISRSFAATGQFDWRGERIDGSLSVSDFIAALSGERSGVKARIAGAPIKLAFDGTVANRASLVMEGTLTADSLSLRNALRWVGQAPPGSGGFGRFALKARASLVGPSIALTNVNVELDGNSAEGVMTYSNTGRQTLQATLAAGALDFTPYVSTVRLLASGARDWNRQLFDLNALSTTDLDMRLSAAKVTVGSSVLGRTALGANLRGGTLALSVGEAQMYGGIVRGSFNVAHSDAVADVKAQFQFSDVDLQACASDLFGVNKLTGRGNLSMMLEASGSSPFGLAQSLDGTATLTGHDGAISGFNVEQLLKRLERRPLSGAGNFRSGSTPFNTLNMSVKFNDGIATAQDIRIDGPAAKLTLTGTASVPAREYDFKGIASLNPATNGTGGFELPFVIQGPWDDPLIFPDPESLIRRSPGAAPLLDAVKDRKTRDAVRSVIERFTGVPKQAPIAEPDKPADAPAAAAPADAAPKAN
ncbi:AsmA family protein [Tardiphaga sp. OK245]|uniref:AsmA family protein n=1 Tax=Tardiphaga sp. OK245 TaxID=1855306 RepID=UPI0008A7D460|nr:AsmA family protein [Tardiphaga sp. OK245]SEH55677.1 AsmA protein [Tardiphaga sp. OK245]